MSFSRILFVLFALVVAEATLALAQEEKAREILVKADRLYPDAISDRRVAVEVLLLYDNAIKADPKFPQSYWNKVKLLQAVGRCGEALKVLNKLSVERPDLLLPISFGGHILERLGRKREATKRYLAVIAKCDSLIGRRDDTSTVSLRIAKASLLLFVKGKTEGIAEYERIVQMFPENEIVKTQRSTFYEFNRKDYLRDICK